MALRPIVHTLTAAALLSLSSVCAAGELYGSLGIPGVMLGYAQPINPYLTLRGDLATAGTYNKAMDEDGVHYQGHVKAHRAALLADVFPFGGVFRVTAGLTTNQYKLSLDASGAGKVVQIGDNNYALGPGDGFLVDIKFPSTTPYLGIGWGHQADKEGGRALLVRHRRLDRQGHRHGHHSRHPVAGSGAGRRREGAGPAARRRGQGPRDSAGQLRDRLQLLIWQAVPDQPVGRRPRPAAQHLMPTCRATTPPVMLCTSTWPNPAVFIMALSVAWSGCMRIDSARYL